MEQLSSKDQRLHDTLQELGQLQEDYTTVKDDIEQAEEAVRVYRDNLQQIEEQNQQYQLRYETQESVLIAIKQDLQQLLNYKNDLEVIVEQQTNAMEQKNRKYS